MDLLLFGGAEAFTIFLAVAISIFVVVVVILTLLAINNLHRLPQMQESLENVEKYLKFLAVQKRKELGLDQPSVEAVNSETEKPEENNA